MTHEERIGLVRQYAAGEIGWQMLRAKGFETYLDVLADLGTLGLRPPAPDLERQTAGVLALRKLLQDRQLRPLTTPRA